MAKSREERFKDAVTLLKRRVPTQLPVYVSLVTPPRSWTDSEGEFLWGDCYLLEDSPMGPHFRIRINKQLLLSKAYGLFWAFDSLIHEYAHVLSWFPDHMNLEDHGPEWGVAYSKCYQAFYGEGKYVAIPETDAPRRGKLKLHRTGGPHRSPRRAICRLSR